MEALAMGNPPDGDATPGNLSIDEQELIPKPSFSPSEARPREGVMSGPVPNPHFSFAFSFHVRLTLIILAQLSAHLTSRLSRLAHYTHTLDLSSMFYDSPSCSRTFSSCLMTQPRTRSLALPRLLD